MKLELLLVIYVLLPVLIVFVVLLGLEQQVFCRLGADRRRIRLRRALAAPRHLPAAAAAFSGEKAVAGGFLVGATQAHGLQQAVELRSSHMDVTKFHQKKESGFSWANWPKKSSRSISKTS